MLDAFFLNVRGLYVPAPVTESGFAAVTAAFILAIVACVFLKKWAKNRQNLTASPSRCVLQQPGLLSSDYQAGCIFNRRYANALQLPALKGFNFRGGFLTVIPNCFPWLWRLTIFTASIAEIVRSGSRLYQKVRLKRPMRLGLKNGLTLRFIIIPQAMRSFRH